MRAAQSVVISADVMASPLVNREQMPVVMDETDELSCEVVRFGVRECLVWFQGDEDIRVDEEHTSLRLHAP
jgi:hypothetical protein